MTKKYKGCCLEPPQDEQEASGLEVTPADQGLRYSDQSQGEMCYLSRHVQVQ